MHLPEPRLHFPKTMTQAWGSHLQSICQPQTWRSAGTVKPMRSPLINLGLFPCLPPGKTHRSEERRVGKECRSLCDWSSDVCSSDLDLSATDMAFGRHSQADAVTFD